MLSAAQDGDVGVTIGRDVHRSPHRRFLRSADGSRAAVGRPPGPERQRRPLTPLSTVEEWLAKSGRFVLTHRVAACSFSVAGNNERMLAAIESRWVDAIATWHNDRLHRSPRELEAFIDLV